MARRQWQIVLAVWLVFAAATSAWAGDQPDHDRARHLYAQGQIRELEEIIEGATRQTPGDVVSVELVQQNGAWVYRLEIVQPDGHRRIVVVGASRNDDGGSTGQ